MIQDVKQDSGGKPSTVGIDPWVPIALVVMTAFVVVTSILIVRHLRKKARTNTASAPARLAFVKEFARLHKSENVGLISYSRFVSVHKIIWKTLAEGSLWI